MNERIKERKKERKEVEIRMKEQRKINERNGSLKNRK